jgi:ABC-type polysaccharide/polyol phosphate export permease
MTAIYAAIFGTAFASAYGGSISAYALAVFTALAVLAFFTGTTSQALSSIVGNGALLNKIALPMSVFPVSVVAANVFQLLVGTAPLLLAVTLLRTHSLVNAVALVFPLAGLVLISLGFGLALSALYVYFRDLPYLYEVLTFILYMTSPVFYPASLVPPSVRSYIALNPIANIVESVRAIALTPELPHARTLLGPLVVGAITLAAGAALFRLLRADILDLL